MISSAHREIFIRYRYYNQFIRYALYELSGIPLPPQDDEIFSIGPDICLFDTREVAEAEIPHHTTLASTTCLVSAGWSEGDPQLTSRTRHLHI